MAIYFGNTKLSAITFGGSNITQISYLGHIYKLVDDVSITFVEAGVSTTVKYPIGSTVSRRTAPSGATFVGWSASSSGGSPVSSFVATRNATYYRVVKYSDYLVSTGSGGISNRNGVQVSGPYYVDSSKYNLRITAIAEGPYCSLFLGPSLKNSTELTSAFDYISAGSEQTASKTITSWTYPFYARKVPSNSGWGTGRIEAIGKTVVG